jgi:hypothetical protein
MQKAASRGSKAPIVGAGVLTAAGTGVLISPEEGITPVRVSQPDINNTSNAAITAGTAFFIMIPTPFIGCLVLCSA